MEHLYCICQNGSFYTVKKKENGDGFFTHRVQCAVCKEGKVTQDEINVAKQKIEEFVTTANAYNKRRANRLWLKLLGKAWNNV